MGRDDDDPSKPSGEQPPPPAEPVPEEPPRLVPVPAEWLTPELEAERKRRTEDHERIGRKLQYRNDVRDNLIPPPWSSSALSTERIDSKAWVVARVKQLRVAGTIADNISKRALAKILADDMAMAEKTGTNVRALELDYIRIHLKEWLGGWPISRVRF